MAYPDPLPLNRGAINTVTLNTPLLTTFVKVGEGRYIAKDAGSPDQPFALQIDNKMDFSGASTMTVRVIQDKNPPAGITGADDRLSMSLQIRVPHRSFSVAEQSVLAGVLAAFLGADNIARLNLGER